MKLVRQVGNTLNSFETVDIAKKWENINDVDTKKQQQPHLLAATTNKITSTKAKYI